MLSAPPSTDFAGAPPLRNERLQRFVKMICSPAL
jgi:hypothetical protein